MIRHECLELLAEKNDRSAGRDFTERPAHRVVAFVASTRATCWSE